MFRKPQEVMKQKYSNRLVKVVFHHSGNFRVTNLGQKNWKREHRIDSKYISSKKRKTIYFYCWGLASSRDNLDSKNTD